MGVFNVTQIYTICMAHVSANPVHEVKDSAILTSGQDTRCRNVFDTFVDLGSVSLSLQTDMQTQM